MSSFFRVVRNSILALMVLYVLTLFPARVEAQAASTVPHGAAGDRDRVLQSLDRTAARLHSVEARFIWDYHEAVVDVDSRQQGTMVVERSGKRVTWKAEITSPQQQSIFFNGQTVRVVEPDLKRDRTYEAGKYRDTIEGMISVGLGGSGKDLLAQFEVKYAGKEKVDGSVADKLELTPRKAEVRNVFPSIVLWIDPELGVSRQQQFFEPGDPKTRNYRLAKYLDIKIKGGK